MADLDLIERLYGQIYRIRCVEEEIARVYPSDRILSPVHLSIGQESVSVAVCAALQRDEVVFGSYRSHALYLAKGGDLKAMIAELFGRVSGCAKGKAGSMHLIDRPAGVMGTSAVVATGIPQAVGYALAMKRLGRADRLTTVFFGDGAVEEGVFCESINFASLHRLPILFVCENNGYAIHSRQDARQSAADICAIARAHGVPAERMSDDAVALFRRATDVANATRSDPQHGPTFLEVDCYRWMEHVGPGQDYDAGYRDRSELERSQAVDQLALLGKQVTPAARERIKHAVEKEIREAFEWAAASPFPDASELLTDVFARGEVGQRYVDPEPGPFRSKRTLVQELVTYSQAVRDAISQEMERDSTVFVMGQGVDDFKGFYGTTRGLAEKFGSDRCFDTPLSEEGMTGVAIGAALAGMRPILTHIRMDFMLLAMNQLINIAAKTRYMYGGQASVPLVVRGVIGRSWGQGAQHSQGLHSMFMHVPGLKVVAPTTPYDAKGCVISAIRENNPVIIVEHRLTHLQQGLVPKEPYTLPLGVARVIRRGSDLTIVAISHAVVESLRAAEALSSQGVSAEVIDPVTLSPLDVQTIAESVSRTGRLLVVDSAWTFCGASAEIVATVAERLDGRVSFQFRRMGFAPVPCPTTKSLENLYYPTAQTIAAAAYALARPHLPPWSPVHIDSPEVLEFKGPF